MFSLLILDDNFKSKMSYSILLNSKFVLLTIFVSMIFVLSIETQKVDAANDRDCERDMSGIWFAGNLCVIDSGTFEKIYEVIIQEGTTVEIRGTYQVEGVLINNGIINLVDDGHSKGNIILWPSGRLINQQGVINIDRGGSIKSIGGKFENSGGGVVNFIQGNVQICENDSSWTGQQFVVTSTGQTRMGPTALGNNGWINWQTSLCDENGIFKVPSPPGDGMVTVLYLVLF